MNILQKDSPRVKTADNIKTNFEPRFTDYIFVIILNSVFQKSYSFLCTGSLRITAQADISLQILEDNSIEWGLSYYS